MTNFVICPYNRVKKNFPEFAQTMQTLRSDLIAKCEKDWSESFGGPNAVSSQFSKSTIMPQLFDGVAAAYQPFYSWYQWLDTTGHQTLITGANSGNIYEDYKIGIAGIAFLDKAVRISIIKMQISDKKLPSMNIEEILGWNQPALIFEEGFILDESAGFHLYAYVTCLGPQRIKLIGTQMNRIPNKLQGSNTGAALT